MSAIKHQYGTLESIKFDGRRQDYRAYVEFLGEKQVPLADFLEHFPAYVGHMSLNRVLTLYEMFKMSMDVAGHIAEIGVYKGAGTLLFAKLVQIFQSESLVQVHGFDWFQGNTGPGSNDSSLVPEGGYKGDLEFLTDSIRLQRLDHVIRLHGFDLRTGLDEFFDEHKHLQFRLVFMDAGIYDVMHACIPRFWQRLTPGGIMVFDQFSHELSPGETIAVRELLPNARIRTLRHCWMPNAYAIKE